MVPAILVCRPKANLALASGDQSNHAAALVRTGFGVLVHVHQHRVVEQRAVAFRNGLELRDQVSELLHVPAADIAEDPLAFLAPFARRLAVFVGVIVMARGGMAEPWKPC